MTLADATAGYYRLIFGGEFTDPIAFNATNSAVDTALEALPNIDNVTVSGSAGGPYTITFAGSLAGENVALLTWRPADVDPLSNSSFVGSLLYEYDARRKGVRSIFAAQSTPNMLLTPLCLPGTSGSPIAVADTNFSYDDLNRLTSILHTTDTTTWAGYDYVYDVASRITSIDSHLDGLSTYTYDTTNQLTGADHTGSTDEAYEYDANGNRVMTGYDTGDNNQLLSDGVHNYTYDAEGNRETRTVIATGYVTEYLWDHRNRLVGVHEYDDSETLLSTVTNTYDAFDRWVRRQVDADGPGGADPVDTFFAWHGLQLALEFTDDNGSAIDGDDLVNVRTWAPGVDQLMADFADGGDLNFGLTDHLGTPRDWVAYDAVGEEAVDTGHQIYDAFGVETYTTGFNSFIGFTGRPYEDTIDLQFNWKRWYEAVNAVWLSEDPIGFAGGSTSLAQYISNNPLSTTDPNGLSPESILPPVMPNEPDFPVDLGYFYQQRMAQLRAQFYASYLIWISTGPAYKEWEFAMDAYESDLRKFMIYVDIYAKEAALIKKEIADGDLNIMPADIPKLAGVRAQARIVASGLKLVTVYPDKPKCPTFEDYLRDVIFPKR